MQNKNTTAEGKNSGKLEAESALRGAACSFSSLPGNMKDWNPRQIEILRKLCEEYKEFRHQDVLELIGEEKLSEITAAGCVVVRWEEHADMIRAKYPDYDRHLDPRNELQSVSIVFGRMILEWLEQAGESPIQDTPSSDERLPRGLPASTHTVREASTDQYGGNSQIGMNDS
jgi:hypothetical protein